MGTVDRSQEPLVSIIVPIYNVEKYLKKCVDSIINQTYKNLEIILVDDGSPDLCGEICDEYVKMDKRIKVIHKINGGLSDARNAGLNIMQGQYVGFVDSDDWIEPNMYARLIENLIDFNADISIGGVTNLLESENGYKILRTTQKDEIINWSCDKEEAMECYFLGTWSAWDKIYKKTIFKDLRFPKGEINEDEAIALQILEQCDVISYTNEAVYNYIKEEIVSLLQNLIRINYYGLNIVEII